MDRIKCQNINQIIHKLLAKIESDMPVVPKQLWISQHRSHVIATDIEVTWNGGGLRWFEGIYGNVFADGSYTRTDLPYSCNITELINA